MKMAIYVAWYDYKTIEGTSGTEFKTGLYGTTISL